MGNDWLAREPLVPHIGWRSSTLESLLCTVIKTQREETDKKLEAIRTSLTTQETAAKADEKAELPGALEVTLSFKAEAKPVKIAVDKDPPVEFLGNFWTKVELQPGRHVVRVVAASEPPRTVERIAEIRPDSLTKLDVAVGD